MNDYLASIFSEKYDIIRAYNGAEACKKIAKQLPNLIISDLMMPVMDGLEFTERVKQDVTTSHIPVILLTAKTDENDHTEALSAWSRCIYHQTFQRQESGTAGTKYPKEPETEY